MSITPYKVSIPEADLEDLRTRIRMTRWPSPESVNDWSQGVPLEETKKAAQHWLHHYSWRRCEELLNSWPQYHTTLLDLSIHFIHIKSKHESATPLLLTHGWPGSVLEFKYVIPYLTDPTSHGGTAAEAFHLVIPSLPGYGFSGVPTADQPRWDLARIASAWVELMQRLGYKHWLAQGGDWGSGVTIGLAHLAPSGLIAAHSNSVFFPVTELLGGKEPKNAGEKKAAQLFEAWTTKENGYNQQQATRPQTVGYALSDSPVGLLAWIYEKMWIWPEHPTTLSLDDKLDHITLYWLTNTAASSARLYFNDDDVSGITAETSIPVGFTLFPGDLDWATQEWVEKYHKQLVYYNEAPKGGHFAAWEEPELFVHEVRAWWKAVRAVL